MITQDSKSVLVVDDDQFFRTKLSDILTGAGHRVRLAADGQEAIDEIRKDPAIDLLLLDLKMPNVDGFGVLQWIRENKYHNIPVLVITGIDEPGSVMYDLKNMGADGLITKNFTPEQLIFRINKIIFNEKIIHGVPRVRVPVFISADFAVGGINSIGAVLNLSETGLFLHTSSELLPGTLLNIRFSLPGQEHVIDVKGIVRWTTGDSSPNTIFGGSGIMFTSISQPDVNIIGRFVADEIKKLETEEP